MPHDLIDELASVLENVMAAHGNAMTTEDRRTREALIARARGFISQESTYQRPAIAIVMDGGLVQAIIVAGEAPRDLIVVDYDVDGADDTLAVPQDGGGTSPANVWRPHLEADPDGFVSKVTALLDARYGDEPEPDPDGCSDPGGHEFAYTGTAYGGDDPSYGGEGRCFCIHCGADGDT